MPRKPRLHVPGGHYHVTLRGNHRQDVFFRPIDRRALDNIVGEALERVQARIHAYCWMTNHVHLMVQVGDRPLGELMQRIGTRYARLVQKSLGTTGHLFERRYHAPLIDVDAYFLKLLRYIHLNPVRAGIVTHPLDYRWSSHRTYLGLREQSWVTIDFGLSLFNKDRHRAIRAYDAFVNQGIGMSSDPSLFEGHPDEPRILGDDQFIEKLLLKKYRPKSTLTLEQLAIGLCDQFDLELKDVQSAAQSRHLARARGQIAAVALAEKIATLSEIARFFNRTASSIARAATRHSTPFCHLANPVQ